MKKIIIVLTLVTLLTVGSFTWYQKEYGGESYYTQITTDGEKSMVTIDSGEKVTTFSYTQTGYANDGSRTIQKMKEYRDRPLRKGAYLKLKVNPKKGVISWEEVSKKEVPSKAIIHLRS